MIHDLAKLRLIKSGPRRYPQLRVVELTEMRKALLKMSEDLRLTKVRLALRLIDDEKNSPVSIKD